MGKQGRAGHGQNYQGEDGVQQDKAVQAWREGFVRMTVVVKYIPTDGPPFLKNPILSVLLKDGDFNRQISAKLKNGDGAEIARAATRIINVLIAALQKEREEHP